MKFGFLFQYVQNVVCRSYVYDYRWFNKNVLKDNIENILGIKFKRVSYLVYVIEVNFWLYYIYIIFLFN